MTRENWIQRFIAEGYYVQIGYNYNTFNTELWKNAVKLVGMESEHGTPEDEVLELIYGIIQRNPYDEEDLVNEYEN